MATAEATLDMTLLPQEAVTGDDPTPPLTYSAEEWRNLMYAKFPGVGICSLNSFTLAQRPAGANWSIEVSGGTAALPGPHTFDRFYVADRRTSFNIPLTGFVTPAATRNHKVWLAAYDRALGSDRYGASVVVTEDTGSGAPAPAGTAGHVQIGTITLPAGATTVLNSHLTYAPTVAVGHFLHWSAPTMSAGYRSATDILDSWTPGFTRNHRMLKLRGAVRPNSGVFTGGVPHYVATLPVWARPTNYSYAVAAANWETGGHSVRIVVEPGGGIRVDVDAGYSPTWVVLDCEVPLT
jgi:hypothetical protein